MRPCPGCAYLVPEAWSDCKRCGAPLAEVAVAPLVHAAAGGPTGVGGGIAAAPAYRSASFAPARLPATDLRPTDRGAGRNFGSQERVERRRGRFSVAALVAVVVVGICGYVGWQRVAHPPVPAELKPWLSEGQSVTFAPAGAGFSVSLPSAPETRTVRISVGRNGVPVAASVAEAAPGKHVVGVAWFAVPPDALAGDPDGPLHAAALDTEQATGFTLDVIESTTHGGQPAIDAEIHRDAMQGNALVVLVGGRVVVVYVLGATAGGAGYDHLRHTFVMT
jgi:hypothetical protein